jgi:hypothetical protein
MSGVLVALAAVAGYAGFHELSSAPTVGAGPVPASQARPGFTPVHLTLPEEGFAASLWPIHNEVKLAAVRMTFAGLDFKTNDPDPEKLVVTVEQLRAQFQQAAERVRELDVPASMLALQERYLEAVAAYAAASDGMIRGARSGDESLLLGAQSRSMAASEDMLRVGEVLWPGEHKPH